MTIPTASQSGKVKIPGRLLPCWIEGFEDFLSDQPTPKIFTKWAAITTVAAACERRIWSDSGFATFFPNLYVLLVGPPASGKSLAIVPANKLVAASTSLRASALDVTKAALVDELYDAKREELLPSGEHYEGHCLYAAVTEFGVLVPAHEQDFLSFLIAMYDNLDEYEERRRGNKTKKVLKNPQMNILSGTQPDYLAELLPAVAWGQGFMSRMLIIYSDEMPKAKLFQKVASKKDVQEKLLADLNVIASMYGEVIWSEGAQNRFIAWDETGLAPVPTHHKLKHYCGRRRFIALKLAVVSAISNGTMVVQEADVVRALSWLLEAESFMPELFKAMLGKSDGDLLRDFQVFVNAIYAKRKSPIGEPTLFQFLAERTPAYNVRNIFAVALASGIIVKQGDLYVPGGGAPGPSI